MPAFRQILSLLLISPLVLFAQKKGAGPNFHKTISANLSCKTPYIPGDTNLLTFVLVLNDVDLEYCDSLAITFPSGFKPISSAQIIFASTNEGQDPESLNPILGQTVSWGNNDNVFGGIEPGSYTFSIRVAVANTASGTVIANYFLSGDKGVSGTTNPKDFSGTFPLSTSNLNPDIAINFASFQRYYSYLKSANLPLTVLAKNLANNTNDALQVELTTNGVSTQSLDLPVPFNLGDSKALIFTPFSSSTVGVYTLKATSAVSFDKNPSNNSDSLKLAISDSVLARVNPAKLAQAKATATYNSKVIFGNWYDIAQSDTLTAIQFLLKSPTAGAGLYVSVYEFGSSPGILLRQSARFVVPSAQANSYTLKLSKDLVLPAGKFFVAVEQESATSIGLALDSAAFENNAAWIKINQAGFLPAENSSPILRGAFFINPIFGNSTLGNSTLSDITVKALPPGGLAQNTLLHAKNLLVKALVSNSGANLTTDASILYKIDGTNFLTVSALPNPFSTNSSLFIAAPDLFTATSTGNFVLTAGVNIANDENPIDNESSLSFSIGDSLISRANGTVNGSLAFGPGSDYSNGAMQTANALVGTIYKFSTPDSLKAITVGVRNVVANSEYIATVYKVLNGVPVFTGASTSSLPLITSGGESNLNFTFAKPTLLKDSVFIAISCTNNNGTVAQINTNSGYYTPNADLIYYPSNSGSIPLFINFAYLNLEATFAINLILVPQKPVGLATQNQLNYTLYPNPFEDILHLTGAQNTDVKIYNELGALVFAKKLSGTQEALSLQTLPSGIYMLNIIDANGHIDARKICKY